MHLEMGGIERGVTWCAFPATRKSWSWRRRTADSKPDASLWS